MSGDKTVKVEGASDGTEQKTLLGHTSGVHRVAFGQDGTCIDSMGDAGEELVWSAQGVPLDREFLDLEERDNWDLYNGGHLLGLEREIAWH